MAREAISFEALLERELADPEFRAEWERLAVAHAVALWLIGYRAEHGLSQSGLARLAGMSQPTIARLEAGDTEPKLSTLMRLVRSLATPLSVHLTPASVEVLAA